MQKNNKKHTTTINILGAWGAPAFFFGHIPVMFMATPELRAFQKRLFFQATLLHGQG